MAQIESICKVTVLARGVASEGRARSHSALVSEPCCWRPRSIARGRGGSKSREGRSGVPVRVLPRCPGWWSAGALPRVGMARRGFGTQSWGVGGFCLPAQSAAPTSAIGGAGRQVGRRCPLGLKVGWGGDASRRSSICSMIKQN